MFMLTIQVGVNLRCVTTVWSI